MSWRHAPAGTKTPSNGWLSKEDPWIAMLRKWMRLNLDAAMLGIEVQRVVGLRFMTLAAGGPTAQAEALRMVSEKPGALAEAAMTLARGATRQSRQSSSSRP
jgi:hypothetical protein